MTVDIGPFPRPEREGQKARWPKGVPHRLWTEASTMVTLMVERTVPAA
jgi:hypothetical protein